MFAPRLSLALALTVCMAAAAKAEDSEAEPEPIPDTIDEIVVRGVRTGELDPVPGASTEVLFTDDYTAENKSLADLLSETAGVYVRRFGGAGDPSEVSIRGSSPNQVVVTIDGVRANSLLTGGLDLSRVCLPLLDRVEVVRGAGSTEEGSGAIGGVVNLVTRGSNPAPNTRVAFSAGDYETFEGSALHAGSWRSLDYSAGYCGFGTQGDFEFARPSETIDGVEIEFEPDSATRLNNDRVLHAGTLVLGIPFAGGALRLSDYPTYSDGGEPGIDSGNGETAGQSTEARRRDIGNLVQLRWDGLSPTGLGGDLEVALHHRYESSRFRDPGLLRPDPIDTETDLQTAGARVADAWQQEWRGLHNALGLQLDFAHDSLRANDQSGQDRSLAGGALEETLRLFDERVVLSARARLDWTQDFGNELLPGVGFIVSPFAWLRLRGQVGRAYRVPNFDELFHPDEGFIRGNSDLEPEDAWNFDAGADVALAQAGPFTDVELHGSWFRREIDESIAWVLVNPRTIAPINTGEATAEGYELSGSLRLTRFLHASANYTWIDSRRDTNGARLPGQPEEEIFARLQLGPDDVWKLVGEVQHVGEILVSEGGSRILPSRTVWNASASLNLVRLAGRLLEGWRSELWVFVDVDNIGDEAVRDAISFPQPGRNVTAGFEAHW